MRAAKPNKETMVSRNAGQMTEGATKGGSLPGDHHVHTNNHHHHHANGVSARALAIDHPPVPAQDFGGNDEVNQRIAVAPEVAEPELLCCGSLDTNPYLPADSVDTNDAPVVAQTTASDAERGDRDSETWAGDAEGMPRWKRLLDLFCVVITLPLWLPLMLVTTLWIKAVSSGPLFYWQERVGHRGRRFMILKFRSMKVNAETVCHEQYVAQLMEANSPMIKLDAAGDPRLIRGGRWLRALCLDELPQLVNVVLGQMSLVGPRPCTPHEFARYQDWQRKRVDAPPGMTGYWQVNGKNRTTFCEMIEMDLFYAQNMSAWLDVAIMFRTAPAIAAQLLDRRQPSWWRWTRQTVARTRAAAQRDDATFPQPIKNYE
jgi:lipopolysaccharide/colanic/teichoic acid biosynthesis glycosyltransferase